MTTPPANLTPVSPAPAQAAKGKTQESASGTPFSQVLSDEIAQNRRGGEAGAQPQGADSREADDATARTDSGEPNGVVAIKPDDAALAAAYDLLRADARSSMPDPALALALPLSLAAQQAAGVDPGGAATAAEDDATGPAPRTGVPTRALQSAQAEPASDAVRPAQESTAKSAAGFATQLAAAQQGDGSRASDVLSALGGPTGLKPGPAGIETAATNAAQAPRLAPTVGTAAWGQALGEKLVWMATGAQQTASLTLNPPNLGPLQIVVNVSNEQATASFFSAQPEVRQALEAAFPRLRDMMNEAGIQLGQATVSADTPRHQAFDTPGQRNAPASGTNAGSATSDTNPAPIPVARAGRGLVDTFA